MLQVSPKTDDVLQLFVSYCGKNRNVSLVSLRVALCSPGLRTYRGTHDQIRKGLGV